jgi:predicted RNA-binding Zn-ribbon protein involved in translation (DUF1610 family)
MKTKTQIAREKEMIKELDNLDISIKFKCPNTGNMVEMSSEGNYSSPVTFHHEEYQLGDYTWDSADWIDVDRDCPECGARHVYNF